MFYLELYQFILNNGLLSTILEEEFSQDKTKLGRIPKS